jgi:hypothetical protein
MLYNKLVFKRREQLFYTELREKNLTGLFMHKPRNRLFRSPIMVLRVEVEGDRLTDNGYGLVNDGQTIWWRDARQEDLMKIKWH